MQKIELPYKQNTYDPRTMECRPRDIWCNPYSMVWVYEKDQPPLLLTGGAHYTREYINKNIGIHALIHNTVWKNKRSAGNWYFNGGLISMRYLPISAPELKHYYQTTKHTKPRSTWCLTTRNNSETKVLKVYRQIPHRWLPEWDQIYQSLPYEIWYRPKSDDIVANKSDLTKRGKALNSASWILTDKPIRVEWCNREYPQIEYSSENVLDLVVIDKQNLQPQKMVPENTGIHSK